MESGEVVFADLQPGERLRLWRLRVGATQEAAADAFQVSSFVYGEMERGWRTCPRYNWVGPEELRDHEKCLIYRLRAGKEQSQVGDDLGVSRVWVNRMERGHECCDRLVEYWEQ